MSVTTTDPRRVIPDAVAGPDVVDLVEAAAPAALVAFEAVEQFANSEHGRAITAYWQAFDAVPHKPDWLIDASMEVTTDLDNLLLGIARLLVQLSEHYGESIANPEQLAETLTRVRNGAR